jgi:hypothetical protein
MPTVNAQYSGFADERSQRNYPLGTGPRILHFRSTFHIATSS